MTYGGHAIGSATYGGSAPVVTASIPPWAPLVFEILNQSASVIHGIDEWMIRMIAKILIEGFDSIIEAVQIVLEYF